MVDLPNHPKSAEGCSSDGQPSDNSPHNEKERDANGNKEDNLLPGGRLQMLSTDRVIIKDKDQSQGDSDNSNHNKLSETGQQSSIPLDDDDDDDDLKHGSFPDENLSKFWLNRSPETRL